MIRVERNSIEINPDSVTDNKEKLEDLNDLVLYNDDHNTFDFVIESLVEVCDHTEEQAEQCAILTHYKGKSAVKSGTKSNLKPYYTMLLEKGLTVKIN